MNKNLRILFVAMSNSIHTARWISQIEDQGWDLHLFPSIDTGTSHSDLKKVTIHETFYTDRARRNSSVTTRGIPISSTTLVSITKRLLRKTSLGVEQSKKLAKLIRNLKPDIIHSMEIQHAGYLTLEAKERFNGDFPCWIVTSWGSDISLFGRLADHKRKVNEVLSKCDYFTCDCERDIKLVRNHGFSGTVFPPSLGGGGFDLALCNSLRSPKKTSERRQIILKGYQGWSGRALVGLRALRRCSSLLDGFQIFIFSASNEVRISAELFKSDTGIPISIIPNGTSHMEILRHQGESRVYLGLGISDGLPNALLEAMIMGAFPIQSNTSCADEWIQDGKTGILVHPEDPQAIAAAIQRAVTDDTLVNRAADINTRVAAERLDQSVIQPQVIEMYENVASQGSSARFDTIVRKSVKF